MRRVVLALSTRMASSLVVPADKASLLRNARRGAPPTRTIRVAAASRRRRGRHRCVVAPGVARSVVAADVAGPSSPPRTSPLRRRHGRRRSVATSRPGPRSPQVPKLVELAQSCSWNAYDAAHWEFLINGGCESGWIVR